MRRRRLCISKSFYDQFASYSLAELQDAFKEKVREFVQWLDGFSEAGLFTPR
ncbi:MAG: ClbS/DfsB family four-helix bundle protein [Firmicutes bacterium]|nr:ClbS/DfsB family four-helix bundle protein [Bacillota bacterium]